MLREEQCEEGAEAYKRDLREGVSHGARSIPRQCNSKKPRSHARIQPSSNASKHWRACQLLECTPGAKLLSNEIISFIINRQSELNHCCCRVIATTSLTCWPSILTSFGFTPTQGAMLQGHCQGASGSTVPSGGSLVLQ
uniref:Prolamin-like domain-containing protein n=1 Tax=Fagus sylvatica TaxID=28930 RepID=A0A2N9INC8_FAGSY